MALGPELCTWDGFTFPALGEGQTSLCLPFRTDSGVWQYVWQIPGYGDRVPLPLQVPLIPSPHKQTSPAISGHFVSSLVWSSQGRGGNQRAISWVIMGRASLPPAVRLPPSISDSEAPVARHFPGDEVIGGFLTGHTKKEQLLLLPQCHTPTGIRKVEAPPRARI